MADSAIHEIVILGAGYGGLRTALDLSQACRRHGLDRRITLVDRGCQHQLITRIHQVATAALPAEKASLVIDELLPTGAVEVSQAEVRALDPENRQILTDKGALPYDRLVVALGSEAAAPPIPGLREHALPLRWCRDAVRLRDHLKAAFATAVQILDEEERRAWLRIAVAGGGSTGVQIVGEIAHWVAGLADELGLDVGEVHLLLIEAHETLLPGWDEWVQEKSASTLRRKGVDVRLRSPLESVSAEGLRIAGQDLSCRTVIWTGGVRGPALLEESGLAVDELGRLRVDVELRCAGQEAIYALGDAVNCAPQGQPLPGTAAVALRQGAYVATALMDELLGRPTKAFQPRDLGQLVSLGGDDAAGIVLGVPLEGSAAGLVKNSIERWYLATVTRKLPLVEL